MMDSKTLIFGIIAGLATALLAAIALTRPGLLSLLLFVAAVPVFFASLSKGSLAGIVAALVAIGSTALAAGIPFATNMTFTIAGPAAYAGHLAGLSRQDDDGVAYWFPLSQILFRLALVVIAYYVFIGLWHGNEVSAVAAQIEPIFRQALSEQSPILSEKQEADIKYVSFLIATLQPLVASASTLAVLVWNMSLAEKLARRKALMQRPKDNIAADSGLPKLALLLFVGAVIVAVLVPSLQSTAFVVVGTMGMAIAMIGLAVLHYYTWGRKGRSQILLFTYVASILLATISLGLFLIVGIAELTLYLRARDPNRMPPTMNTESDT
jgi:hypothetical protein